MNQYDVGYLDLIIADESHHSGYNVHDDLFKYFDALQVSLTATPVDMIGHATYGLFGCEGRLPTAEYSLEAVVADDFLTLENSSICLGDHSIDQWYQPFDVIQPLSDTIRAHTRFQYVNPT